jgi:hypothetical protein
MKIYGMIVMLRYHQTNAGALNTMVALKWNGNGEIDILVTILVCWRLGPYADPDQQGDRSVAANIDYSLVSDLSYFFLQLRIGPTDLFMVVPRNDAIFPKLHTNRY